MTERKYALTKIKRGDYLLPSNDAKTVWRLATYRDSTLSAVGTTGGRLNERDWWGVWKWTGPLDAVDIGDAAWDNGQWQSWDTLLETQAQAIESALGQS